MKKSVLLITLMLFSGNIWSMQNVNCSEANVLQQNRAHLLQLAKQLDVEEIDTQILEQLSQREIELRSMLDDLAQQYAEFNADQYAEHFGEQSEIANNFSFIQNALRASVQEINTIKDDCRPIFDQSIIVTGLLKLNVILLEFWSATKMYGLLAFNSLSSGTLTRNVHFCVSDEYSIALNSKNSPPLTSFKLTVKGNITVDFKPPEKSRSKTT